MSVIFKNARIIDVLSGKIREHAAVITFGNKIERVTDSNTDSGSQETIDCENRFLLPGMVDAHVHLDYFSLVKSTDNSSRKNENLISRLHSYLYCGVTSIYDAGNDPDLILSLRNLERTGKIVSPRIFCTGSLITCKGGHNGFAHTTYISSMPQDEKIIDDYLSRDPDIVKVTYDEHNWGTRPLIPILPLDNLRKIVDYCHSKKYPVTVHTSNEFRSREAISSGVDSLAHPVIQSPVTDEFVWLVAQKKLPVVSTLAIGERYSRIADHPEYLDEKSYRDCFSGDEIAYLKNEESERQRKNRWMMWMKVMTPVAQENLKRIQTSGGIIACGTDLTSGPDYQRELELLQEAGVAPIDVLRAATYNGAIFLSKEKEMGSITEGKIADFILLDEDPTLDVRNIKSIWSTIKNGKV